MSALAIQRDDGPLAARLARALAGGREPAGAHPLAWLVPPLVRLLEYGSLLALTALAEPDALPVCFAFLGVLAFHHYDTVYRLRYQGAPPPGWVRAAGGGWEGRIIAAGGLALAGVLGPGLLAGAIALGLVWAAESGASWLRFAGAGRPAPAGDDGDVLE